MSGSRFGPGEYSGSMPYRPHPGQHNSSASGYHNVASPTGYRQASSGSAYGQENGGRQRQQDSSDSYTSNLGGSHAHHRVVSEQSIHTYHSASGSMAGLNPAVDRAWTPASRQGEKSGHSSAEDALVQAERIAQRHWQVLDQFLGKEREPAQPRMVKAREKLTRLSGTQFQELSKDVYDEVLRRRFSAQGGPSPASLEADPAFHPKRNQARERLSSLTVTRFGDLASDVYHEIGRRFPGIARQSADAPQAAQPRSSDLQPPLAPIVEQPKPNLRNTTFIPVKSAMIEDDEEDEDIMEQVPMPPRSRGTDFDTASTQSSDYVQSSPIARSHLNGDAPARQLDRPADLRVKELEDKLALLQVTAKEASDRAAEQGDLESALQEALERNDKLEAQVQQLQSQAKQAAPQAEELSRAKKSLADQQDSEQEMRQALDNLMAELRQMSDRETSMQAQLEQLEQDLLEQKQQTSTWQAQAQKSKLALRQVKVTSAFFAPGGGLSADGTANGVVAAAAGLISATGIIEDLSFAQFQGGIDELLRVARMQPQHVLEPMRTLVTATKAIQANIRQSDIEKREDRVAKLMIRLSSTANNLMIACRNHVGSAGLSPVSLVDAAASHLTSTVIELAKICKIRSIPQQAGGESDSRLSRGSARERDLDDDLPFTPHAQNETPHNILFQITEPQSKSDRPPLASPDRPPPAPPAERKSAPSTADRNSTQDLKISLEAQTEAIVTSIQKLLSAIRLDQKPAILQQFIGDVVVSVTTATSLLAPAYLSSEDSRSLKQELQGTREALESCCSRLRDMENGAAEQPADGASKDFKQRLAGVAFDTAKQTKELSMALERFDSGATTASRDEPDLT